MESGQDRESQDQCGMQEDEDTLRDNSSSNEPEAGESGMDAGQNSARSDAGSRPLSPDTVSQCTLPEISTGESKDWANLATERDGGGSEQGETLVLMFLH